MAHPEFHLDRARAESFGAVAQDYDRHRPDFPAALVDDLAALGSSALDLGCGTGKVARALARRGVAVLGIEVDPAMAAVARGHGVAVEVARFEAWDDAGRRFDLVTCGDTWHWLEPTEAAAAVARVLRPGGTLARFWNLQVLDEPLMQALDPVYREFAPEVYVYGRTPAIVESQADTLPALVGPFTASEPRVYHWHRDVTAAGWAAFCNTISDHRRLPAERRLVLLAAIRAALEPFGDVVRVRGRTSASFARRVAA